MTLSNEEQFEKDNPKQVTGEKLDQAGINTQPAQGQKPAPVKKEPVTEDDFQKDKPVQTTLEKEKQAQSAFPKPSTPKPVTQPQPKTEDDFQKSQPVQATTEKVEQAAQQAKAKALSEKLVDASGGAVQKPIDLSDGGPAIKELVNRILAGDLDPSVVSGQSVYVDSQGKVKTAPFSLTPQQALSSKKKDERQKQQEALDTFVRVALNELQTGFAGDPSQEGRILDPDSSRGVTGESNLFGKSTIQVVDPSTSFGKAVLESIIDGATETLTGKPTLASRVKLANLDAELAMRPGIANSLRELLPRDEYVQFLKDAQWVDQVRSERDAGRISNEEFQEYLSVLRNTKPDDTAISILAVGVPVTKVIPGTLRALRSVKAKLPAPRPVTQPTGRVLDIGAGQEPVPAATDAVDLATKRQLFGKQTTPEGVNFKFKVDASKRLPYKANTFDHVVSRGAALEADDAVGVAVQLNKVLRQGGTASLDIYKRKVLTSQDLARLRELEALGTSGARNETLSILQKGNITRAELDAIRAAFTKRGFRIVTDNPIEVTDVGTQGARLYVQKISPSALAWQQRFSKAFKEFLEAQSSAATSGPGIVPRRTSVITKERPVVLDPDTGKPLFSESGFGGRAGSRQAGSRTFRGPSPDELAAESAKQKTVTEAASTARSTPIVPRVSRPEISTQTARNNAQAEKILKAEAEARFEVLQRWAKFYADEFTKRVEVRRLAGYSNQTLAKINANLEEALRVQALREIATKSVKPPTTFPAQITIGNGQGQGFSDALKELGNNINDAITKAQTELLNKSLTEAEVAKVLAETEPKGGTGTGGRTSSSPKSKDDEDAKGSADTRSEAATGADAKAASETGVEGKTDPDTKVDTGTTTGQDSDADADHIIEIDRRESPRLNPTSEVGTPPPSPPLGRTTQSPAAPKPAAPKAPQPKQTKTPPEQPTRKPPAKPKKRRTPPGPASEADTPVRPSQDIRRPDRFPEVVAFKRGAFWKTVNFDSAKVKSTRKKPFPGLPDVSGKGAVNKSFRIIEFDNDPPRQRELDEGGFRVLISEKGVRRIRRKTSKRA